MKYLLVMGDIGSGFDFVGPFDSVEEAENSKEGQHGYLWICRLHEPICEIVLRTP